MSVSSEKWLDVEEVQPTALGHYLQNMQQKGYTIIGVEQTANSKNLTAFEFPRKSVLLLGNEKFGKYLESLFNE